MSLLIVGPYNRVSLILANCRAKGLFAWRPGELLHDLTTRQVAPGEKGGGGIQRLTTVAAMGQAKSWARYSAIFVCFENAAFDSYLSDVSIGMARGERMAALRLDPNDVFAAFLG